MFLSTLKVNKQLILINIIIKCCENPGGEVSTRENNSSERRTFRLLNSHGLQLVLYPFKDFGSSSGSGSGYSGSSSLCNFSHIENVPFSTLKSYLIPNFHFIMSVSFSSSNGICFWTYFWPNTMKISYISFLPSLCLNQLELPCSVLFRRKHIYRHWRLVIFQLFMIPSFKLYHVCSHRFKCYIISYMSCKPE